MIQQSTVHVQVLKILFFFYYYHFKNNFQTKNISEQLNF